MSGGTLCIDPRNGIKDGKLFITVETDHGFGTVDFSFHLSVTTGLNLM